MFLRGVKLGLPVLTIARGRPPKRWFSSSSHFAALGQTWWDIDGPLSTLHDYNYVRVPFIAKAYSLREKGRSIFEPLAPEEREPRFSQLPIFTHADERAGIHLEGILKGSHILDVGCGGGILAESLAKCGAKVLGIDPSEELIDVAEAHRLDEFSRFSAKYGLRDDYSGNLAYEAVTIEDCVDTVGPESFDIVVASEVLEHVENRLKESFLDSLCRLVKPGGIAVITTPGRSLRSYFTNIFLAETVLKLVPRNTHQYDLLISADDLSKRLKSRSFEEEAHIRAPKKMAFVAYLRRHKKGELFDPYCDSKFGITPTLADPLCQPQDLTCGTCGKQLSFLFQLGTAYKETVRRVILVYICKEHLEEAVGWRVYRHSSVVENAAAPKMSAFDEMNSLSSWVSDLDLVLPKKSEGIVLGSDNSQRIIIEEDFVTPLETKADNGHSEALFTAYKQRNRDDIDEEDRIDIDNIIYNRGDTSPSDDESIADSDDISVDPCLLEFQDYVSQRPGAVIRYHWAGRPLVLEEGTNVSASCGNCGEILVFEFQALPEFMKHISQRISSKASMHIGSVLFYTCKNDCQTGGGFIQEHATVLKYV